MFVSQYSDHISKNYTISNDCCMCKMNMLNCVCMIVYEYFLFLYSSASLDFALQLLELAQQLLTLEFFLQLLDQLVDQQVKWFLYCLLCVHTCMHIQLY